MAKRDLPVIKVDKAEDEDCDLGSELEAEEADTSVSIQFSEKANSLLAYIDKTYLGVRMRFGQACVCSCECVCFTCVCVTA